MSEDPRLTAHRDKLDGLSPLEAPEQFGRLLAEVSACRVAAERCAAEQVSLSVRFAAHERDCTEYRLRMLAAVSNQGLRIDSLSAVEDDDKSGITRAAESGDVIRLEREAREWRAEARRREANAKNEQASAKNERTKLLRLIAALAVLAATGGAGLVAKLAGL